MYRIVAAIFSHFKHKHFLENIFQIFQMFVSTRYNVFKIHKYKLREFKAKTISGKCQKQKFKTIRPQNFIYRGIFHNFLPVEIVDLMMRAI